MKPLKLAKAMTLWGNRKSRLNAQLKLVLIFLFSSLLSPLIPRVRASEPAEFTIYRLVTERNPISYGVPGSAVGVENQTSNFLNRSVKPNNKGGQIIQPVVIVYQRGNCSIQTDGTLKEIRLKVPHIKQPAHSSSCGPAALTMILNYSYTGQPAGYEFQFSEVTQKAIDQGFYLPGDSTRIFTAPGDLAAFARTYNVLVAEGQAETTEAGLEILQKSLQACKPVIVDLVFNKGTSKQYTHFVVVTGITGIREYQPDNPELTADKVPQRSDTTNNPIVWVNDPLAVEPNIPYSWSDFKKMWQNNTDPWKRGYPTVIRWWMTVSSSPDSFAGLVWSQVTRSCSWGHINLTGGYVWSTRQITSLENLPALVAQSNPVNCLEYVFVRL